MKILCSWDQQAILKLKDKVESSGLYAICYGIEFPLSVAVKLKKQGTPLPPNHTRIDYNGLFTASDAKDYNRKRSEIVNRYGGYSRDYKFYSVINVHLPREYYIDASPLSSPKVSNPPSSLKAVTPEIIENLVFKNDLVTDAIADANDSDWSYEYTDPDSFGWYAVDTLVDTVLPDFLSKAGYDVPDDLEGLLTQEVIDAVLEQAAQGDFEAFDEGF